VDVLEERGPKEALLKNLGGALGVTSMSSTWIVVTMRNHALNLLLGEATLVDAILAKLE